jgi:hypothetical protein
VEKGEKYLKNKIKAIDSLNPEKVEKIFKEQTNSREELYTIKLPKFCE